MRAHSREHLISISTMAKGNMLLGHARGKVGSLVFSRQNGKQVTRAKAETVRNPQTEKQIVQRIILNTISQAYSRMAAITDHSFEGKSNPSENMAAFMKRNMNELRSKISRAVEAGLSFEEITNFAPIGTSNFVYNPLVISMGALPKIPVISVTSGTGAKTGAVTANTYQAVIDAFGLQRGDQLTFVNIVEDAQGNKYFYYSRVILNPVDAEGNNLPLTTAFISQGAIVSPSPKNEGQFAALSFDTTGITFAVGNTSVKAAAIIVSREKGDGSYARSEASLVLDENAIDESVDMCTLQDAIDQFQENGVGLDNSKYLNNASSKGSAATTPAGPAEIVSAAINDAAWDANKPDQVGVRTYSGTTSGNTKGMSAALVEGSTEPAVGSTQTVYNSGAITNGAFSFQNTEPEVGESKRVFLVVGKISGSSIKVEAAWPYYAVLTVGD